MTRAKICGITRSDDLAAAVDAGAAAVGVISEVSVETPREVSVERARTLVADVPPFVTGVLVMMPESVEAAVASQQTVAADALQVYDVTASAFAAIAERVDADVIAAVDAAADVAAYAGPADAVLVDTTSDGGGGTGETHDWERTRELTRDLDVPVVLAGGLAPANVGEAVQTVDPFGVDVASGVEREGGIKDHEAVRAFLRETRRAT
jgi:phosphoribosylanthranilate isomerase